MKPCLPRHYRFRVEPPDGSGDERLVFTSERRRIVIRGHSFREFVNEVIPLLDGSRTLPEIAQEVADTFALRDLEASIAVLAEHGIIEDAQQTRFERNPPPRLNPQLNFFREVSGDPAQLQAKLAEATVAVVGLGAIGTAAATALAATSVGCIRCIDSTVVTEQDSYLLPAFTSTDIGKRRTSVAADRIEAISSDTRTEIFSDPIDSDAGFVAAIAGANFVLGCLDPGVASLTYKLNRACLQTRTRWCSAQASAFEGMIGPTVVPHETACYLCYQMRAVACAEDPQDALADLKHRDRQKVDQSDERENLSFSAAIVGNLAALEAFKFLVGLQLSAVGRIIVIDFLSCVTERHVVLRKPWCPACFASQTAGAPLGPAHQDES